MTEIKNSNKDNKNQTKEHKVRPEVKFKLGDRVDFYALCKKKGIKLS